MEIQPSLDLLHGKPIEQHAAIMGRWAVLQELNLGFTSNKLFQIARDDMEGYRFVGAIRKTWSGLHGNSAGLSVADIETAAQVLDVYEDVLDYDY